jgi:hypothetical protein
VAPPVFQTQIIQHQNSVNPSDAAAISYTTAIVNDSIAAADAYARLQHTASSAASFSSHHHQQLAPTRSSASNLYQQSQNNNNNISSTASFHLSAIEAAILRSAVPIDINETEEVVVNGQRGIWANKSVIILILKNIDIANQTQMINLLNLVCCF